MSNQLGFGPKGPWVIVQIVVMLAIAVPGLIWFESTWSANDPGDIRQFAPLVIVFALLSTIVRKCKEAQAYTEVATDPEPIATSSEPLGPTGFPITKQVGGLNEFWDAAIGDQLRKISSRLDMGPNGANVLANLLVSLLLVIVALTVLTVLGPGIPWWFIAMALCAPFMLLGRSVISVRSDLKQGWRDGPDHTA